MPTRKSNFKYLRFIMTLAILCVHTGNTYKLRHEEEYREQHHRRGAGGP